MFTTAIILVPIFKRIGLGSILGYIFAGIVVAGICLSNGIYNEYIYRFILVTVALTMAATPLIILAAKKFTVATAGSVESEEQAPLATAEEGKDNHIIIVGFGRIGETVANMLSRGNISYLALENNPNRLKEARQEGYEVYYANFINGKALISAGVREARSLFWTGRPLLYQSNLP